jgi:Tetratricopeptide repeat
MSNSGQIGLFALTCPKPLPRLPSQPLALPRYKNVNSRTCPLGKPAVKLVLTFLLLGPLASAQRPPAPAPPPPSPPPTGSPSAPPTRVPASNPLDPTTLQPTGDVVTFLLGRVATSDGTALPSNVIVERVCNSRVRQQVYASPNGSFTMDLGSRFGNVLDASAEGATRQDRANKSSQNGIPRTELANCELRAAASGFRSDILTLFARDSFSGTMDVGPIVVQRLTKIQGMTISATPYNAPKDARKNYEKGVEALKSRDDVHARQYFEKAVQIYPKFANAWFQLGRLLQKSNETAAARAAYTQATNSDTKFLPPYLSLSYFAYDAKDWPELLNLTGHILALDPLNYARVKGYILDLDSFDYAEAYFYNSVANFNLNNIEEAEKSGLKAAYLDVRPRFPQLHLLLADIFIRKRDGARAATELQTFLDLVPHASNAEELREQIANLQKPGAAAPPAAPVSNN